MVFYIILKNVINSRRIKSWDKRGFRAKKMWEAIFWWANLECI